MQVLIDTPHLQHSDSDIFPHALCGYKDNLLLISGNGLTGGRRIWGKAFKVSDNHIEFVRSAPSNDKSPALIAFCGSIVHYPEGFGLVARLERDKRPTLNLGIDLTEWENTPRDAEYELALYVIKIQPGTTLLTRQIHYTGDVEYVAYYLQANTKTLCREVWSKDLLDTYMSQWEYPEAKFRV